MCDVPGAAVYLTMSIRLYDENDELEEVIFIHQQRIYKTVANVPYGNVDFTFESSDEKLNGYVQPFER